MKWQLQLLQERGMTVNTSTQQSSLDSTHLTRKRFFKKNAGIVLKRFTQVQLTDNLNRQNRMREKSGLGVEFRA
jgi:hypothetical protein